MPRHNCVPILMPCGSRYPSIADVARAYGVKPQTVARALDNGTLDKVGTGQKRGKAFEYRGVTYASKKACALAHGVPEATLKLRLKEGRDLVTGARL
jgi:transposase-like protein